MNKTIIYLFTVSFIALLIIFSWIDEKRQIAINKELIITNQSIMNVIQTKEENTEIKILIQDMVNKLEKCNVNSQTPEESTKFTYFLKKNFEEINKKLDKIEKCCNNKSVIVQPAPQPEPNKCLSCHKNCGCN